MHPHLEGGGASVGSMEGPRVEGAEFSRRLVDLLVREGHHLHGLGNVALPDGVRLQLRDELHHW